MKKLIFILFAIGFIVLLLLLEWFVVPVSTQIILSIALIFLLGIPHGAIDHVLFLEKTRTSAGHFYIFYLGLMAAYLLLWLALPIWSLILFLFLSAYHFGQSQFSDMHLPSKSISFILYLLWGGSILSGLMWYHYDEIASLFYSGAGLRDLAVLFDPLWLKRVALLSTGATVGILGGLIRVDPGLGKRLMWEMVILVMIHLCFYFIPPLLAFTVYFVTLHSLKVLFEEYRFLKKTRSDFSPFAFVKLLLPYSLLSISGTVLLLAVARFGLIPIPDILLVFVVLSLLTLPHSIVMDQFYLHFYRK